MCLTCRQVPRGRECWYDESGHGSDTLAWCCETRMRSEVSVFHRVHNAKQDPVDRDSKRTNSNPLRPAAAFTAVLIVLNCLVELAASHHWQPIPSLHDDRGFWMPLAAVLGMMAILAWRGCPRSFGQVIGLVGLILVLIVVNRWSVRLELVRNVWLTTAVVIQLAMAACWILAVGGLFAFLAWLPRRVPSDSSPLWIKWWVATTLFIGLSEIGIRVLEPPSHTAVRLPEHWSSNNPPGQEFRIAAIGGSTMLGFPYEPKIDIPNVCRAHLERVYPGRAFIADNVALGGINLRTAIEQLQSLENKPDLILVYTGHNEAFFDVDNDVIRVESAMPLLDVCFEWSVACRAVATAARRMYFAHRGHAGFGRKLFDSPQYSEQVSQERLARFRRTLIEFSGCCRQEDIRLIWFVPAAGEGTFEPNRSCSPDSLSEDQRADIRRMLSDAGRLEQSGRWDDAENIYRQLSVEHPCFAEFHFRLAESLVEQDEISEAKQFFQLAIDWDGHPCRAPSSYQQCIADVARQEGIPLIDAEAELSTMTDDGLLDRSIFHDNVHMTIAGYWALGRAAAESIVAESLVESGSHADSVELDSPDVSTFIREAGFDKDDLATAYDRTAFALEHLARQRYDSTQRITEAAQYRLWAVELRGSEIQPGEGGTESLSRLQPAGVRFPAR